MTTERGPEAVLIDPVAGTRAACTLPACVQAAREGGGRGGPGGPQRTESRSPDEKSVAFIRDWNLWVRDVATGRETPLTTDGVKDFGYATDNAGWTRSDRPILVLVAGLEENRDLPAGSASGRRDVSGRHQGRPSQSAGVEISAARRRRS